MQFKDTPAFTPMKLEEERAKEKGRVLTIRLNEEEEAQLIEVMNFLQQPKDSTAYKQMFKLGYINVLQDQKVKALIGSILENRRKNWRTGIQPESFEKFQM